jgi:hypothetical protein
MGCEVKRGVREEEKGEEAVERDRESREVADGAAVDAEELSTDAQADRESVC